MKKVRFFVQLLILLSFAFAADAGVIKVPTDQPTIQAGINAAIDGDTVLVAAGTYFENINLRDKNIVVASHFILNEDLSFIESTIINGSQPTHPDTGSCVIIGPRHDSTTVLAGFTLTAGTGTVWQDIHDFLFYREGGGLLMDLSSPVIKNNIIINNIAIEKSGIASAGGGGIRCGDSTPIIENNIIKNNQGLYGGGIVMFHSPGIIRRNIIIENSGGQDYGGGGIWISGAGTVTIVNNTIIGNEAIGAGAGNSGVGGGIMSLGTQSSIYNNIIWDNTQAGGGPIVPARSNSITYNDVQGGYEGIGNIDTDPLFADSTFALSENSPCIDAGDPKSPLDPDGTRPDIGAKIFFHLTTPYIWMTNYEIDDSAGNNNDRPDADETVNLHINLINTSLDATGVTAQLVSDDPTIQINQNNASFGNMVRDQESNNINNPFSFYVEPRTAPHTTTFVIDITADGGYTNRENIEIVVGTPDIILIDDDEGANYENYFLQPMNEIEIFPEHWDTKVQGTPTMEHLQQFKATIWFTGDDREKSLTTEEQTVISTYLDEGGKLLLTGQNIGFDLVGNGTVSDSIFFHNYLYAKYVADSSNAEMSLGVNGDPITDKMFVYFQPTGGAGNQTAPDIIEPIDPAETILNYIPGLISAGIRLENEMNGSKLIYLGFGIEGVSGPQFDTAAQLLKKSLAWLIQDQTSVDYENKNPRIPDIYRLEQNYPNPFNPTTTITFSISERRLVSLKIYDLLGREVATLINEDKDQGYHKIIFDGFNLKSGFYFYKIQAGNFVEIKKALLLK